MIKIEDVDVFGFRKAIKGMRNAMNSWDNSDSYFQMQCSFYAGCEETEYCNYIGEKDMELAKRLIKAGSSDRKFMRMIHVQADVTAPLYWWKEYDTYKVGTTANSCSTMHKITDKEFTLDDFSHEHLAERSIGFLQDYIDEINRNRSLYVNGFKGVPGDNAYDVEPYHKIYWHQIIQLLPSSYNQMRTIDLSYETLAKIYRERKNHKLDEWHTFCDWILTLPYMKEFLNIN